MTRRTPRQDGIRWLGAGDRVREPSAPRSDIAPSLSGPEERRCLEALLSSPEQRVQQLETELAALRNQFEAAVAELESNNEELRGTNRELMACNEELQSTSQELQSVNEELYTLNTEHHARIKELERLNLELESSLRGVEAGVLLLDERLGIVRFNDGIARVLELRPEDVGRSLEDVAARVHYGLLARDAKEVLVSGQRKAAVVNGPDGALWSISCRRVPISGAAASTGVIVTVKECVELEQAIKDLSRRKYAHELSEQVLDTGHAVLDLFNEVVWFSEGARRLLGLGGSVPGVHESLPLFAPDAGASPGETWSSLRLERGLPFAAEREVRLGAGAHVRVALNVSAKVDLAEGLRLVIAVLRRSQES